MMYEIPVRILPHVCIMGQVRQAVGWNNRVGRVDRNMWILLLDGTMVFEVNGSAFSMKSADYLLIPKGACYRVRSESGCLYAFAHFETEPEMERINDDLAWKAMEDMKQKNGTGRFRTPYQLPDRVENTYVPESGRTGEALEKIRMMLTECDMERCSSRMNHGFEIDLRFARILSLLQSDTQKEMSGEYPAVLSRILVYIHEHYTQPLTLAELSERFSLSRQYIMRLFQKHLNITVTRYINRLKMEHARELLRYSTFRVGQVSEILGFSTAYYFCRIFRQYFDMTPTQYIRMSAGMEEEIPQKNS